jgi:tRNA dimethylallyltransferase
MQAILCLMGPTGAGKTNLALALAERYPIEIISVDSAMVYRGMDIGTAKPMADELAAVPHHLIDICDPSEAYSAERFASDAKDCIEQIRARGHIPVCVGGTMLYYRALQQGLHDLPEASQEIREQLQQTLNEKGLAHLHATLSEVDPASAERIHPNDPQRILRALEVFYATGTPLSEHWQQQKPTNDDLSFMNIALAPNDRAVLHARIEQRLDAMLAAGFIKEVMALHARGDLSLDCPSMRAVGYRQVWQYLEGELDQATMREKAIIATRQLAKRQLTWLRQWPELQWLDSELPLAAQLDQIRLTS